MYIIGGIQAGVFCYVFDNMYYVIKLNKKGNFGAFIYFIYKRG